MRHMRRALSILLGALWLGGCGRIGFGELGDAMNDGVASALCDRSAPFPALEKLTNFDASEVLSGLTLTDDGRHALFSSFRSGRNEIWETRRASVESVFDPPTVAAGLNLAGENDTPSLSGDGLTMVFASTRDDGSGSGTANLNLWWARRRAVSEPFPAPNPLPSVNDANHNSHPFFASATNTVYFTTQNTATSFDLYQSGDGVVPDAFGVTAALRLDSLNTNENELSPVITADLRTIYFASDAGGGDDYDVWYSERATPSEPFPAPRPLGGAINTGGNEFPTWISRDHCELYFTRSRAGGSEIYVARRSL